MRLSISHKGDPNPAPIQRLYSARRGRLIRERSRLPSPEMVGQFFVHGFGECSRRGGGVTAAPSADIERVLFDSPETVAASFARIKTRRRSRGVAAGGGTDDVGRGQLSYMDTERQAAGGQIRQPPHFEAAPGGEFQTTRNSSPR